MIHTYFSALFLLTPPLIHGGFPLLLPPQFAFPLSYYHALNLSLTTYNLTASAGYLLYGGSPPETLLLAQFFFLFFAWISS